MKISLFQGILLGVFALAALVGLYVFATFSGSSASSSIGTVVIWGTLPSADMQTTLVAAVKNDSALKNVSYVQQDPSTFEQNLVAAIADGDPPDLALISQEDLVPLAKVITPIPSSALSTRSFENDFTDGSTIYLEAGNAGAYGIPFLIDPLVLYDNKATLSSSGVASPPKDWEALTGLVPNIATLDANGNITRGLIALGGYDNVHDARAILSALFLQAGVPLSAPSSSGLLAADLGTESSNAGGQAPGDAVLNFYAQFADPSKVSYTWNASLPDSQTSFVQGNLALYIGYASEASLIAAENPHLAFDVSPLPQPETASASVTYGQIYAFVVPHGATNASGAVSAAAALVSQSTDDAAAAATGLAPALRTDLATPPADPVASVVYASALYTEGWLSPAPASVDQVFSAMITSVTSGSLSVDTALSTAQSALSALYQQ